MNDRVLVAPRELIDLVYRCGRSAGVAPGIASELARSWLDAARSVTGLDAAESARFGIPIERSAFDCLSQAAEAFLVAERLLDEIAES